MTRTAPSLLRRTSLASTAAVALLLLNVGSPAATGAPLVTGSGTGSIIAEAATSPIAVTATGRPNAIVFSADGSKAYVADGVINRISIIDVATNTETATIALPGEPTELSLSRDGLWLYAAEFAAEILKINTTTLAVTTLPAVVSLSSVAVSPDGTRVYGQSGTTVEVLNTSTGATIASIPAGFTGGASIIASPDGHRVYAGSLGDNKIAVIDTATNTVTTTITTAGAYPTGFGFSPDGSRLYVTAQLDDTISIIATATNTVTTTGIAAGSNPTRIAVSPNGLYAYVSDNAADTMTVIDLTTDTAIAAPATGVNPNGIAVSPDGTRVFVGNYDSNDVTAFDVTRLAFTGQGEVTPGADATFAFSLTNGDSPIANYSGGTAVVELLNSSNAVVATGTGVSPAASGQGSVVVSTSGLAMGVYSVRITFTQGSGVVVALAAGFSVAALAATGTESGATLVVAFGLVVLGAATTWAIGRHGREKASGRRISPSGTLG
jgi:YVTN family beta-propeller protein